MQVVPEAAGNLLGNLFLIMEVPCCHSMLQIIRQAYDAVKPDLPVRQVVISTRGEVKAELAW